MKVFLTWYAQPPDPKYWAFFKPQGIMLSFSGMSNRKIRRLVFERLLTKGVHKWLDFQGIVAIDSMFSTIKPFFDVTSPRDRQYHTVHLQKFMGGDIIVHKDYPILDSSLSSHLKWKLLRRTVLNAEALSKISDKIDASIIYVVQGWDTKSLRWCVERYLELGVEYFGIGSLKNLSRVQKKEVINRIKFMRELVRNNSKIHVFGVLNPLLLRKLVKIVDSIDTSAPITAAAYGDMYYIEDGKLRRTKIERISKLDVQRHLNKRLQCLFEKIDELKGRKLKNMLAILNAYTIVKYVSSLA